MRVEKDLYDGIRLVRDKLLFDRHVDLYRVARVDLLPGQEAVEVGSL